MVPNQSRGHLESFYKALCGLPGVSRDSASDPKVGPKLELIFILKTSIPYIPSRYGLCKGLSNPKGLECSVLG